MQTPTKEAKEALISFAYLKLSFTIPKLADFGVCALCPVAKL